MAIDRTPDYAAYHRSLTDELYSVKDRIRNLATHWGVDGESKEVALRSILRRHLPESMIVGRGFITTPADSSTQIDVLIVDANKPTLFKDGDLLIVTPDAVRAVIEVKTRLRSTGDFAEAFTKLSRVEEMCRDVTGRDSVWTGLFVYEGEDGRLFHDVLNALGRSYLETKRPINCASIGKDIFARYWPRGKDVNSKENGPVWHSYLLEATAPSYFIGNLIDWITTIDHESAAYAWFPLLGGKEVHRRCYLPQGSENAIDF